MADGQARIAAGDLEGHNLVTLVEHAQDAIDRGEDGTIAVHLAHIEAMRRKLAGWDAKLRGAKGGAAGQRVTDEQLRECLEIERKNGTPDRKLAAAISKALNLDAQHVRKRLNAVPGLDWKRSNARN